MKTMKQTLAAIALVALSTTSVFAGGGKADSKYVVNGSQSNLVWKAEKITGKHDGNVKISSGEISVNGGKLVAGTFVIDMSTITVADIKDADMNGKLLGHLRSDDFFGVEKFKTATFVVTSVTPASQAGSYKVKGNLTIKGITKPIEFPAAIVVNGGALKATATITVDRTQFDIRYASKSFFESIGDKAIYDNFTMELQLVANQK
ncbi:MAG TPA: YceI family protein [Phnomibacter sp.]|nr:YceI family protein [Phnomibacter sp.]